MNHGEPQDDVTLFSDAQLVRTMQIVAGALMMGVTLFAVIALAQTWGKQPNAEPIISYIACGVAALMFVMRIVISGTVTRSQIQQSLPPDKTAQVDDDEKRRLLLGAYQTSLIVGFAMLEGAAFFCLVAYIVDASWIALGAGAVLWASMVATFPTKARVDDWVRDQLQLLNF